MNKPINVISLLALSATSSIVESAVLDNGKIIGMSIFKNGLNNTGLVQASLDCNGNEILPLSHIENYRNRDTAYNQGFIPLNLDGGKKYTVKIIADANFTADTPFQAVFYYDVKENQDC